MSRIRAAALAAALFATFAARAADYSFTGFFDRDDDVRFVDFAVGWLSRITLRTYSYGGGTNAAGREIPAGGFDTIVTVFRADGTLVSGSDDGLGTGADPRTGRHFDTMYELLLAAGRYRAAITQYDNTALGPRESDGFTRSGEGDFTPALTYCEADRFCDVSGAHPYNQRTPFWALDVLNVNAASLAPVPEPGTWALIGLGIAAVFLALRNRRHR